MTKKKLPKTNIIARKLFHLSATVIAGIFVLLSPQDWIIFAAVAGFILVFLFEFIRLNTVASTVVNETVGPLFKKKEFVEASGLFWLTIAALIAVLFASPLAVAYGLFVLGFADTSAALGGTLYPSRKLYRRKTLAGFISFFIVASLISFIFALMFVPVQTAIVLGLVLGILLAVVEIFSHPFDDNFTIMLFGTTLLELSMRFL